MKASGYLHYRNYGLDLLFKALSISYVYFNKVGLKVFNPRIGNESLDKYYGQQVMLPSNENLYLLPDFLFDNYTLLDTEISDSPHYELMKKLQEGQPILETEYISRSNTGTIDMRPSYKFKESFYRSLWEERMKDVESGTIKPILIVKVRGSNYILDGKHRAALLKLLNLDYPCILLENIDMKLYFDQLWKKIKGKQSGRFKKHMAFYGQL